ncbi:MAG: hypothetical protein ACRC42_03000 [Mycoplasma sp.]
MALPSSGTITMSQINAEIGRAPAASVNLNDSVIRTLAGRTSGSISMSHLHGKRYGSRDHLTGWATSELQQAATWDSGVVDVWWNNIPRSLNIRNYIHTATSGSDRSGANGYAYIRVIIYNLDGGALYDNTWVDAWTNSDGAAQLRQWNREVSISSLVGNGDNVKVLVKKRIILGDYRAHIWGERHWINRLCGIQSWVG